MKLTIFRVFLVVEAAVCVLLCIMKVSLAGVFPAALAFPFEQIGAGLRALSLSGAFGNVIAIVFYIVLSLLPVGILLILSKKRKLKAEDWLLVLLSAILFGVLYLMINPGYITKMLGAAAMTPIGNAMLGGMVYSMIAGYLILRILRLFSAGNTQRLEHYLTAMLGVLNVLFVLIAFGVCFSEMLSSISSLKEGNAGNEHLLGATYVFLALQYAVNALPYILDVFVVFSALRVLSEMRKDRYSIESVAAAEHMTLLCARALTLMTLTNIGFNLLQLLFARLLMTVNSSVQIPVISILFVLAILLLSRFITENKQLKDENDQFI